MTMIRDWLFILIGYLSGSILFAELAAKATGKQARLREGKDGNPGTANAFMQCGFWCGTLALLGDVCKGCFPIIGYVAAGGDFAEFSIWRMLVLAAPVVGHVFPVFYGFRGGKGIAVSFGCLLGLLPLWQPLIVQAVLYIFFSLIIRVCPHRWRTVVTYSFSWLGLWIWEQPLAVIFGYGLIALFVIGKHFFSHEPQSELKVRLLWMH